MELQNDIYGQDYEKSKIVTIEEDIYRLKSKKRMLEFDLSSEEFRRTHISTRRSMASLEGKLLLGVCIPATLLIVSNIITVIQCLTGGGSGLNLLLSMLIIGLGTYPCVRLWKDFFRIARQFYSVGEMVGRENEKPTFWMEKEITRQKISDLKKDIFSITEKIKALSIEKTRLKEEEGILSPLDTLRQELEEKYGAFSEQVMKNQLTEMKLRLNTEKKDMQERIANLEKKLNEVNRKTIALYDDIEQIKCNIYKYVIVFLLFALMQNFLSGLLQVIVVVIGILYTSGGAFYLYQVSKDSVILMVLEKKPNWIKTYAFQKNIISLSDKRKKIVRELTFFEGCLEEIEEKLANLE